MNDSVGLVTTPDERTMATLAQVLQLVGGFIAPLIIFFLRRESKFVSFHALQVLLYQIVHFFFNLVVGVGWFLVMFTSFFNSQSAHNTLPPALFLFFPLLMVVMMGFWLLTLALAIIYGIKAGRGEWAGYPLLGGLARHILKIGSGDEPITT